MTKEPLSSLRTICWVVCGNGRPSLRDEMRVRDDIDARSSSFTSMLGGNKASAARKEPASYWFDRRYIDQFDIRVQSFRTSRGRSLDAYCGYSIQR